MTFFLAFFFSRRHSSRLLKNGLGEKKRPGIEGGVLKVSKSHIVLRRSSTKKKCCKILYVLWIRYTYNRVELFYNKTLKKWHSYLKMCAHFMWLQSKVYLSNFIKPESIFYSFHRQIIFFIFFNFFSFFVLVF